MVLLEPVSSYHNVYHFTTGQNNLVRGSRTPAMWIYTQQRLLFIYNTDHSGIHTSYASDPIPLNQKVRVVVEQVMVSDHPVVRIFIDQDMVHEYPHNWKIPFKNVKLYLSDPWHLAAPVKILYFNYEALQFL